VRVADVAVEHEERCWHDANAVAVLTAGRAQLGFVPRAIAVCSPVG